MALKNKKGQTAAEVQSPVAESSAPESGQSIGEVLQDFSQQLTSMQAQIVALQKELLFNNDSCTNKLQNNIFSCSKNIQDDQQDLAKEIRFRVRDAQDAVQNDLLKLLTFATGFLFILLLIIGYVQNEKFDTLLDITSTNQAILKNEKVFWYDEENHNLYLDSREKLQQYQAQKGK